jgi:hypothetical protein
MSMATSAFVTKAQMQGQTPANLCEVGERLLRILASDRRLSQCPALDFQARRRIEAVIAGLIDALEDHSGHAEQMSREQGST